MYPIQPISPSITMWQRVLRIRAYMYQDEQQKKPLEKTYEHLDALPIIDIYEQQASWKLWMERINNVQTLLLESGRQEQDLAKTIENVLEILVDGEEWENFDKFKDDNGFDDVR